jgi:hypothetical protein
MPEPAQWTDVTQFQTEDRAKHFRDDPSRWWKRMSWATITTAPGQGDRNDPKWDIWLQTTNARSLDKLKVVK